MTIRFYGALTGAFLLALSGGAQAGDAVCGCKPVHHTVVRHTIARPAPAHIIHQDADAEYAQSYCDYHSSSTVSVALEDDAYDSSRSDWRVAPNDARIRFHYAYGESAPQFDEYEFSGGVGDSAGAAIAYQDGFGNMHYGRSPNGPTYNSYSQSFQAGGAVRIGPVRAGVWAGYNGNNGIGNGY